MVKSETRRDAEAGILKSEPETKKCSGLIEKHICDEQTQNLRLRDPLESSARFRDLGRICRDSQFSEDHSPPLVIFGVHVNEACGIYNTKALFCHFFPLGIVHRIPSERGQVTLQRAWQVRHACYAG